jgi:hypothetical protein
MHVDEMRAGTEGAVAVIAGSAASTGVGMAVGGIVAVIAISAIFYAVGRGEDRDRAQAASERAEAVEEEPDAIAGGEAPRSRLRLPARPRTRRRR